MKAKQIALAASALLQARRHGIAIKALPENCVPESFGEAYQIQDAVSRSLSPVIGWKISVSNGMLLSAPIHQEWRDIELPIPANRLNQPLVEPEIAFIARRDIPRGTGVEDLPAMLNFVPLFEVLSTRYADFFSIPFFSNFADNFGCGGIVIGEMVEDWRHADRDAMTLRLTGHAMAPQELGYAGKLDQAIAAVAIFADQFAGRFDMLPAGSIVTTGSMVKPLSPQREIVADYGPFGVNRISFSGID